MLDHARGCRVFTCRLMTSSLQDSCLLRHTFCAVFLDLGVLAAVLPVGVNMPEVDVEVSAGPALLGLVGVTAACGKSCRHSTSVRDQPY